MKKLNIRNKHINNQNLEENELEIKKLISVTLLLTLFSLMTLSSVYGAEPTEPHEANPNAMWIEPSTHYLASSSPLGTKFNITLWANISAAACKGWQIWLFYADNHINVTRAGYTAGSKSDFFSGLGSTFPVPLSVLRENATHMKIAYGEAAGIGESRGPGYGSLCWIEYEYINSTLPTPEVLIPISIKWAYEAMTPPKTYILGATSSEYLTLVAYDGLVVIPEFSTLVMLIGFLALATPIVIRARSKDR